ncbi:WD domain, G-beta repeat protein [Trichuris suis]|nr:WD domain, G-beta repeat protein [Trichuris suis]
MLRYNVRCVGGSRLIRSPPCFLENGQLLACCVRSSALLYSAYTAEICGELRHGAEEVIMLQCIEGSHVGGNLITATKTGNIRLWSTKEALLVDTWKLEYKAVGFRIVSTKPLVGYFVLEKNPKVCNLYRIVLNPGGYFEWTVVAQDVPHDLKHFCFANRGRCFAYITRKNLSVCSLTNEGPQVKHPYKEAANWVCIAGHPHQAVVATGDVDGVILIWNNLFRGNPVRTVCHWHTMPIGHLAFNQSGSALYSGGQERVVVKWNLHNPDQSEGRDYLPRIAIQLVTAMMKITQSIQSIALRPTFSVAQDGTTTPLPAGLTLDVTGLSESMEPPVLIFNGRPGELQFYSLATNSVVFNLEITGKMLLPVECEKEVHSVDVSAVAVVDQWMVTVEERQNDIANTDRKLKFWKYNRDTVNFDLDTCVEYLPGTVISSIRFVNGLTFDNNPTKTYLALATTCLDGRVNFWTQTEESDDNDDNTEQLEGAWRCRTTLTFRELPANFVANSESLSMIAIAFGCTITLWNSNDLVFRRSMNVCDGSVAVRQLEFALEEDLLLAMSTFTLTAWSVRHLNRVWTVKMSFSNICIDPISGVVAAFTIKNVLLFKVNPLSRLAEIRYPNQALPVASIFVPSADATPGRLSTLYYFTMEQYMYRIEWDVDQEEDDCREDAVMFETVGSHQTQSWTSTLVGRAPLKQLQTESMKSKTIIERLSEVDKSLAAPAHTLPSLDAILRPVLLSLIPDR